MSNRSNQPATQSGHPPQPLQPLQPTRDPQTTAALTSLAAAMADLYGFFGWPGPSKGESDSGTAVATTTPKWSARRPAWAKWDAQPRDPEG